MKKVKVRKVGKKEKITKNSRKEANGITLIALVITIIVLLILAAVSIATLTGENGILTKANDASETTKDKTEEEQVKVAVNGALTDGTGTLSTENIKKALKKEFGTDKVTDTTFTGEGPWTFKGERKSYTIEKNGNITSGDTTTSQTGGKLAKDVLKVNTEASEDAQDYEKSPYVKYNNILCRVFYNDAYEDGNHGLQIISADNIKKKDIQADGADEEEKVTLGDDSNFEQSKNDYNEAVDTLNNKAKDCMSETDKQEDTVNKIAIDARSLGSIATLKNRKFQGDITEKYFDTTKYNYLSGYEDQFLDRDDNYIEDVGDDTGEKTGQLRKLGLNATSDTWLASRDVDTEPNMTGFYVCYVMSDGTLIWRARWGLCHVGKLGNAYHHESHSFSRGFRPIFLLSSDVKIKSGDGTKDSPYELEI